MEDGCKKMVDVQGEGISVERHKRPIKVRRDLDMPCRFRCRM